MRRRDCGAADSSLTPCDEGRARGLKTKRDSSHAQADAFVPQNHRGRKQRAGAKAEEKASACSVRNDVVGVRIGRDTEEWRNRSISSRRSDQPDVIPSPGRAGVNSARNLSFVFAAFLYQLGAQIFPLGIQGFSRNVPMCRRGRTSEVFTSARVVAQSSHDPSAAWPALTN
jgi:hypothetical protein